jgi:hypothetical protein
MAAAVCPFLSLSLSLTVFFVGSILWYSQSGDDDPQEDLARSGYKLNMKSNIFKTSFYIFG